MIELDIVEVVEDVGCDLDGQSITWFYAQQHTQDYYTVSRVEVFATIGLVFVAGFLAGVVYTALRRKR